MSHSTMLASSPFYASVVERYGRTLDRVDAGRIAADHGTTLITLVVDGDLTVKRGSGVDALELVQALGY